MTTSVAGVVPSAGRSRRMGAPKALLEADGRTFLQCTLTSLQEGGCAPLVVVVRSRRDPVASAAEGEGAEVVENPRPEEGPVGSVRAAIRHLGSRGGEEPAGLVLHPVDHPLVRPGTVRLLVDAFRARGPLVTVPVHRGRRGHPVLLSRDLFPELLDEALEGGARTVVRAHRDRTAWVEVDDEGILLDIDTPDEYRSRFGRPPRTRAAER